MSELLKRVRCKSLHSKIMSAEDTIRFFKPGMNLGWSGFTPAGYPKVVPIALADHVEKNNLQRQVLFTEQDAADGTPKAVAASTRLAQINSEVRVEGIVADVHAGNIEKYATGCNILLDGTDNLETRFLINDVAVKHRIPWVYGACVAAEGMVMPIIPGETPCLRCI